jgi:hypothetical protein
MEDFLRQIQTKVDEKLDNPPNNQTIEDPFGR